MRTDSIQFKGKHKASEAIQMRHFFIILFNVFPFFFVNDSCCAALYKYIPHMQQTGVGR